MTYSRSQLFQWQWADTQRATAQMVRIVTDPEYARRHLAAAEQLRARLRTARGGSPQTPTNPDVRR